MGQSSAKVKARPTSFLPGWIIATVAIFSLIGAVALGFYAMLHAEAFPTSWEGFWICCLVGLLASTFYYGLFPQYSGFTIQLDRFGFPGPAVLVGPLAIWAVVTFLLWHFLPQTGRVYLLAGNSFPANIVHLEDWAPKKPGIYLHLIDPERRTLAGIYLEFDDPLVPSYKVTPSLGDPPISTLKPIEFSRYSPEQKFTLEDYPQ
jgi:hypothetical protein